MLRAKLDPATCTRIRRLSHWRSCTPSSKGARLQSRQTGAQTQIWPGVVNRCCTRRQPRQASASRGARSMGRKPQLIWSGDFRDSKDIRMTGTSERPGASPHQTAPVAPGCAEPDSRESTAIRDD